MKKQSATIFLGLSGGVDSALAAALLVEQGYHVVPVFLKWWAAPPGGASLAPKGRDSLFGDCPWEEDQASALSVAKHLGIDDEFRTWNFSREFFENVLQPLIDQAEKGRTGNPDIDCNRVIKFGAFLKRALQEGADLVATGHYARISLASIASDGEIQRPEVADGDRGATLFQLLRACCDAKNDQTYFLYQLTQDQLSRTIFPLGEFSSKEAVRAEARKRGLPTADRKSTCGICGIDKKNYPAGYASFLGEYITPRKGDVVTTSGRVVGIHDGVERYTYGQRKGIGVTDGLGPYYVVAKDQEKNELVVAGPAESQQVLYRNGVLIRDAHWISGAEPKMPLFCRAFIRHPQDSTVRCTVAQNDADDTQKKAEGNSSSVRVRSATLCVRFAQPQWAPTPGQSIVFYESDIVLGGGVII